MGDAVKFSSQARLSYGGDLRRNSISPGRCSRLPSRVSMHPRSAERIPSHPPLRPARQQSCRQHRARTPVARRAVSSKTTRDAQSRARQTPRAAASMPLLRRTHDHHRDLRAWLRAKPSPHTGAGSHQDRHLMMMSEPFHHRSDTRYSCRLAAGSVRARTGSLNSTAVTLQISSCNAPATRSRRHAQPCFAPNPSPKPLPSLLRTPARVAKSP